MRPLLRITACENFKGQDFTGTKSFDLNAYRVLYCFPIESFPNDAEMKKTKTCWCLEVKDLKTSEKKVYYASKTEIENQ